MYKNLFAGHPFSKTVMGTPTSVGSLRATTWSPITGISTPPTT